MKNKMTLKLIVVIVLSVALLAGIMAPVYFYLQPKMYVEQETRRVAEFSDRLKEVRPFINEELDKFFRDSGVNYRVYVFDENYEPLYSSFELGNNQKFIRSLFGDKTDRFQEDSGPYYAKVDDEPAVRLYTLCEADGKTYYIQIKDSLSGVDEVFGFSNRILAFIVMGYIIICCIALYLAISPSVKSVKEVTKVAKNISENNLSVRYQGKIRKDEIGELAQSVNKMADTIQENITSLENYNFVLREDNRYMKEYEETRRMLVRNVTHDLKTPLAVISSQVEMLSICTEQEKKDHYYQSAMEEINKMSKMISGVLQMTVDERRLIYKDTQELNISELIGSLCDSRRAYIRSRNLTLSVDITSGLCLNTVKEYVEYVFKNYLSNAVQNANTGSQITVLLEPHQNAVRLSVENYGSLIPDDMKDKIWTEAFTTSPEGTENTGLGLYIVKEISLMEHTECGFDNIGTGVRFWFDFINCPDENQ